MTPTDTLCTENISAQNISTVRAKRSHSRGFTLLEFVFALTIIIILVVFIYSSVVHTSTVTLSLEQHIKRQHRTRAILDGMVRELRLISEDNPALLIPPNTPASSATAIFFRGTTAQNGTTITFIAAEGGVYLPGRQNQSGLVQITYRMERNPEDQEKMILVREEVPVIFPTQDAYEKAIIIPVSKNILGFQARFYDPIQKRWKSEWTQTSTTGGTSAGSNPQGRVPSLVEITLNFATAAGSPRDYTTVVATRAVR